VRIENKPERGGQRDRGLDALRGLAIFGMALSGMVPWNTLPAWMYHAQLPPPDRAFNQEVYGITWVDLVFPYFLFAMGVAIPLALGKRLEKGDPAWKLGLSLLWRGLALAAFAIVVQHFRPTTIDPAPERSLWWLAILFFVSMVMAFGRWPSKWPVWLRYGPNALGAAIIVYFLATLTYPDGSGFDPARSDIILLVLANVAFTSGVVWLFTRNSWLLRVGVMGAVLAIFLTAGSEGVGGAIAGWTPLEWLYRWDFQKYLLIVLPGTILGDLLRREKAESDDRLESCWGRQSLLMFAGLVFPFIICWMLLDRMVESTFLVSLVFGGLLAWFCGQGEGRYATAVRWGLALLLLGLLFEPLGGGIRKDTATVSYFFVTAGLASWTWAGFAVLYRFAKVQRGLWWLADGGANPMLGYIAITTLVPALVRVTGLYDWVAEQGLSPWAFTGFAFVQSLLVMFVAAIALRYRVVMRV
jgi:predicted acyltransferase